MAEITLNVIRDADGDFYAGADWRGRPIWSKSLMDAVFFKDEDFDRTMFGEPRAGTLALRCARRGYPKAGCQKPQVCAGTFRPELYRA